MGGGGVHALHTPALPNGGACRVERLIVSRRFTCGALTLFVCVCETPCHDTSRSSSRLAVGDAVQTSLTGAVADGQLAIAKQL
jgi:hypothetical protein